MKYHIIISVFFVVINSYSLFAQDKKKEKNYAISGYVKNIGTVMFGKINDDWLVNGTIQNRINFKWYISNNLTSAVKIRNRFVYGEFVKNIPDYDRLINVENGFIDLSDNLINEKSFLLNSAIDRVWLDFTKAKLQIRAGRQRINWAQNFVWNPNDIFNTYSFFDIDYEEKPGSDAVRIQYYTSTTSSVEFAVKGNKNNNITGAALYKFNKWSYDFQFIGGILDDSDIVAATGWSGHIKDAGFRGEISYLHPKKNFNDTSGVLIASVSADYTFKNSLFVQFETLYNENADNININSFDEFYYIPLSVKNLSFTKYSLFGQISYPVTPLLKTTISGMYYPLIHGFFIGPSIEYSLKTNLDLSLTSQNFKGEIKKGTNETLSLFFIRIKWSF